MWSKIKRLKAALKGRISVSRAAIEEDQLLERALEAGAEDVASEEEHRLVTTAHDQLYAVARALKASGLTAEAQKLICIPETSVPLPDETVAAQVLRLCDALEDNDDVQDVHANFDLSEELLTKLSA